MLCRVATLCLIGQKPSHIYTLGRKHPLIGGSIILTIVVIAATFDSITRGVKRNVEKYAEFGDSFSAIRRNIKNQIRKLQKQTFAIQKETGVLASPVDGKNYSESS